MLTAQEKNSWQDKAHSATLGHESSWNSWYAETSSNDRPTAAAAPRSATMRRVSLRSTREDWHVESLPIT